MCSAKRASSSAAPRRVVLRLPPRLSLWVSTTAPLSIGTPLPPQFLRHLTALALGVLLAAAAVRIPLRMWRRLSLPLWGVGVALLGLTLAAGIEINGGHADTPGNGSPPGKKQATIHKLEDPTKKKIRAFIPYGPSASTLKISTASLTSLKISGGPGSDRAKASDPSPNGRPSLPRNSASS